jgi:hypothetical protein
MTCRPAALLIAFEGESERGEGGRKGRGKHVLVTDCTPYTCSFPFHPSFSHRHFAAEASLDIKKACMELNTPHPASPTKNRRSAGPGLRWCLLSITGLVAPGCADLVCPVQQISTSEKLACLLPATQAERRYASWV